MCPATADPALKLELADAVTSLRDPRGLALLLDIVGDSGAPRLPRIKAERLFEKLTGRKVDPDSLEDRVAWLKRHEGHLKWIEATGRFE